MTQTDYHPKYAVLIPTWQRPKALTKLFKKCPALNGPSTYVGIERDDLPHYKVWQEEYGNLCNVVQVNNPGHYPSNAHQQIKQAVDLARYERVVFTDDNAVFTNKALYCLLFAHTLFPNSMMSGAKPIASFYNKDSIEKGQAFDVPGKWQPFTGCSSITVFDQLNMTFWAMDAAMYNEFDYTEDQYAWDIEVVLWMVLNGGITSLRGCLEAEFEKHKHDNKESGQEPWYKLFQLGESISLLAQRYPEWANPTWMTYRVDIRRVLRETLEAKSNPK